MLYSYPKLCRRARNTQTQQHTNADTYTRTLVCHTTAKHTQKYVEHCSGEYENMHRYLSDLFIYLGSFFLFFFYSRSLD